MFPLTPDQHHWLDVAKENEGWCSFRSCTPSRSRARTAWHHSTYIKWTGWTLAMALPWWQHHKYCLEIIIIIIPMLIGTTVRIQGVKSEECYKSVLHIWQTTKYGIMKLNFADCKVPTKECMHWKNMNHILRWWWPRRKYKINRTNTKNHKPSVAKFNCIQSAYQHNAHITLKTDYPSSHFHAKKNEDVLPNSWPW